MSERRAVRLPVFESSEGDNFPPGAMVKLKSNSAGAPGIVRKLFRGKFIVEWPSDGYTGRHKPDALIAVKPDTDAPKENPHDRILRKLREDKEKSSGQQQQEAD